MATLSDLKSRIADDLSDSSLSEQVENEIKDAIDHYAVERFWFNETRAYTFDTAASDDTYTLAADEALGVSEFITIDYLEAQIGGIWRRMRRVGPDEMASLKENASAGQPLEWCMFGSEIQIDPTPSAVYTIRVTGHFRFPELEADGDSNAWTNEAKTLIRQAALKRVLMRVRQNFDRAQIVDADEMRELDRLRREHSRRTARGVIQPWC